MRLLFLFLLLINGVIYLWYTLHGEPVQAKTAASLPQAPKLVLLSEQPGKGGGNDAATITTVPPKSEEPNGTGRADETPSPQQTARCYTLGPFMDEDKLATATQYLMSTGRPFEKRASDKRELMGYWVLIPPLGSLTEAQAMANELKTLGDRHHYVVKDPDVGINAISLGVFRDRKNAERRYSQVKNFGYNVTLKGRYREDPVYWIDFTENGTEPALSLEGFVGAQRLPRVCTEIASKSPLP